MSMAKKNLLVITNSFPDKDDKHIGGIFVKEQLRYSSAHFDEVYVIYPSAFGVGHRPKDDFRDYTFGNARVFFLGYFNVPLFLRVFRGGFTMLMARAIDHLIDCKKLRFDMIHAHFTWPSGAAAVRLKKKHKVPLVVTEHTSLTLRKAIATGDPEFLNTWMASDAVVRVRKGDIASIASLGVPTEKLHYIPNGFDSHRFRPMDTSECRERLGLPLDKRILLSVGGLDEVKGHSYLIEAMEDVVKTSPDVVCYIVGDGSLENLLKDQVRQKGLDGHIKLVGGRPHDEMPFWMNSCNLFVHPSLSEGNPGVMFEALGCGRPFIGTKVGGVPEVVTSEDVGLLCDPADEAALARNISVALGTKWDRAKIVAHSSQYASEWVSKELSELYDRLLSKG